MTQYGLFVDACMFRTQDSLEEGQSDLYLVGEPADSLRCVFEKSRFTGRQ